MKKKKNVGPPRRPSLRAMKHTIHMHSYAKLTCIFRFGAFNEQKVCSIYNVENILRIKIHRYTRMRIILYSLAQGGAVHMFEIPHVSTHMSAKLVSCLIRQEAGRIS